MTATTAEAPATNGTPALPLALRLARRELRGGLKGFRIFLACLMLGVAAIAGVGSVSEAMLQGLRDNGRALLGGDMDLRIVHRRATAEQLGWIAERAEISEVAELRAMVRGTAEEAKRILVELRAVDGLYPLYGAARLAPAGDIQRALALTDGAWGAVADRSLLRRLDVGIGDRVQVGETTYQVRAVLEHEPDRTSAGLQLGPTFMVARDSLAATGLEQPGSLIHYHYRLRLPAALDAIDFRAEMTETFPQAGWRIRDTREAAPGLQRFIVRLTQFLTLVGLTSLLVGGVGVGNAVKSYLDEKTATIATLKCLGASSRLIFQTYLAQVMALALVGVLAGLVLGAASPYVVAAVLGDRLGWQSATGLYPVPLAVGAAFGVLTALAFALWPLAKARNVPAASLFRDLLTPVGGRLDRGAMIGIAGAGLALAVLSVVTAADKWLAVIFVGGAIGTLIVFRLAALGLMRLARAAPRARNPGLRLAIANLHRPGAPTAGVVLSLGLGLTVLVAIALIEGNLSREVRQSMPAEAPAFYFIDIQPQQIDAFKGLVGGTDGGNELRSVPMLRGRITSINGTPPERLAVPSEVAWVFQGDRGLTWSRLPPENAEIVDGDWWPEDYSGEPLVSLDAEIGRALGIGPGDRIGINVLGRDFEVAIANLRLVNWANLTINFVMIFSPGLLEGAPQTHIATVKADLSAEDAVEIAVTDRFANVSAIRVKEALNAFSELIGNVATAVRVTASVALVAGVLVLAGAVAAGHRRRVYESVVLKVVGATRRSITQAYLLEYGLLGLVTAAIAAAIGSLAAWLVLTEVMEMPFTLLPLAVAGTALLAAGITIIFGFAGTWRALAQKAAPLLRNA